MDAKRQRAKDFASSPLGKLFLGGLPILGGVLTMLVSLSVLPYVDTRPDRIQVFNDPHTWEVFAVGLMMTTFGVASIIPPHMTLLVRLNKWLLLIAFLAVVTGVILKAF